MSPSRGRGRRGRACGPEPTTRAPRRAIGRCRPGSHTPGVHLATVDDTWCSSFLERTEPSTSVPDTQSVLRHTSPRWGHLPPGRDSVVDMSARTAAWLAFRPDSGRWGDLGVVSGSSAADAAEDEERYSDDDQYDENGPQHCELRSLLVSSEGIRGPGVASHPNLVADTPRLCSEYPTATKSSASSAGSETPFRLPRVGRRGPVRAPLGPVCRMCRTRRSYRSSSGV
jgi:hypothetical protein